MDVSIRLAVGVFALAALVMMVPAAARADAGRVSVVPKLSPDPAAVAQAKARAAGGSKRTPATGDNTTAAPPTTDAVVAGSGLNQPGLDDANWTPSDVTGAIGPGHYVEMVEQRIATYDRRLNLVSSFPLNQFFGTPEGIGCEGQMLWDQSTRRFYYAGLDCDGVDPNHLYYGWSKTADPSDLANGWCRYEIDTGASNEDSPRLGDDNTHLIIGNNAYAGLSFQGVHVWAIKKPGAGAACPAPPGAVTPIAGVGTATPLADAYSPTPANGTDSSANGYVT